MQQFAIAVSTHLAMQVPAFCNVEVVQASGAVQLVGQAPVCSAAIAVSQVSPVPTLLSPQVTVEVPAHSSSIGSVAFVLVLLRVVSKTTAAPARSGIVDGIVKLSV